MPLPSSQPSASQQALSHSSPSLDRLSVFKQLMKRLETAAYSGDLELVVSKTEKVLQEVEPTMPSQQFGASLPAAAVNAASKRQMSQPMGSSKPLKKQKLMRATNSTTRQTKTSTTQLWGGFKQVG